MTGWRGPSPRGLGCVVAQVLIIISLDDGRELPIGIIQILMEEDGVLQGDETMVHHQTLPFPRTRQRRQLGGQRCLPDGWTSHHLVSWGDGQTYLSFLFLGASLIDLFPKGAHLLPTASSPTQRLVDWWKPSFYYLPFLHQRKQRERVRQKLLKIKFKRIGDELTLACLFIVATGSGCRLGTLTVPM